MNKKFTIQPVQTQSDQPRLRESLLLSHKDFDQQILSIPYQNQLQRQAIRSTELEIYRGPFKKPSQSAASILDRNQANSKLSEKSIDKDGKDKD